MNRNKVPYVYSLEVLRKFQKASTTWKLNWLEEINKLTEKVLTRRQKKIRDRLRRGLLK